MKALLILSTLSVSAFAGPIGSGGPNQQIVDVTQSVTLADRPDERVGCEDGSSRAALQLLMMAKREAKKQCQSRKVDWFTAGYSVSERRDGVPSFDCVLALRAYCHVNVRR